MKIKKELIQREIAGDTLLIPVGNAVYQTNGVFILTELSAFIWNLLPQVETEEELLTAILENYEVDETTARNDLQEFLSQLKQFDIID